MALFTKDTGLSWLLHASKYACRKCEDGVLQAPASARLIEGGPPTEATVARVLVSNMPTICRSIGRPRSTLVGGSTWTGPHWRTGSVMLPGTSAAA
jgi:hypothetical protein